jgi:hypothetical protein
MPIFHLSHPAQQVMHVLDATSLCKNAETLFDALITYHTLNALNPEAKKCINICSFMIPTN